MVIRPTIPALALSAIVVLIGASAQAAPDRASACPAPKPLPAGVKKPPKGANATQFANFLLALPQRKPCDVSLFTSTFSDGTKGLYTEGPPMTLANGAPLNDAQARRRLAAFTPNPRGRSKALSLFDRADTKAKVPEPSFRAAFAALVGTVGESTTDPFLGPDWATIRVGGLPESVIATASEGVARSIIVNRRYGREDFRLLVGVIAHEILLHDFSTPQTEEAILNALTAIIHMRLLSRHPELATSGTELSRQLNDEVMLLANSRAPGSVRPAIVAPSGRGVAPGSPRNAPDLFTFFGSNPSDSSPAPSAFATVLRRLLAPGVAIPKPLTYSKKTAQLFSKMNDTWLSPVDRLRVNVLLGVVSVDEIVKYTGVSRAKAISMFKLAPILAAMK